MLHTRDLPVALCPHKAPKEEEEEVVEEDESFFFILKKLNAHRRACITKEIPFLVLLIVYCGTIALENICFVRDTS